MGGSFTTSSLRGWVVCHYGGLSPVWSFIRVASDEGGLMGGWVGGCLGGLS